MSNPIDTSAKVANVVITPVINGFTYQYEPIANATVYYLRYNGNTNVNANTTVTLGNVTSGSLFNPIYGLVNTDLYFFGGNTTSDTINPTMYQVTPLEPTNVYESSINIATVLNNQTAELGPTSDNVKQYSLKLVQKINKIANDNQIDGLIANAVELHRFMLRQ